MREYSGGRIVQGAPDFIGEMIVLLITNRNVKTI